MPFILRTLYLFFNFLVSTDPLFWGLFDNFWKNSLIITYSVDGDKAVCYINIKLKEKEVYMLKKKLKELNSKI